MRRRALPLVLAFVLGLGAAFAASCTGQGVDGGIPQVNADDLKAQIGDVQEFVDRNDCGGIDGQLNQVTEGIDNLPSDTDAALVENLRQGVEQLESAAISACNQEPAETTTETQPQETVTEAIPTVTTPPETTATTPPPATETTPPVTTPTEPVPPATTTPAVPQETLPDDGTGGQGIQP